ncbi:EamA family transporter, partial [Streptomyces sp. NPDC059612]
VGAYRRTTRPGVSWVLGTPRGGAPAGAYSRGAPRLGALGVAGAALVLVGTGWGRRSVQRAAD